MAINPGRVKALFQLAIDRSDPADRRAFLDREVGDDAELRDRLDALLLAHDELTGVPAPTSPPEATVAETGAVPGPEATLEATGSARADRADRDEVVGTEIAGRYKVRQAIGEGGMGSVYLAEQARTVRRMVALKLIKPGMDSRAVLARFDSERQALAMMDHPNIAKVLDAGTTDAGRPFFVMELVKGVPLTEFCDAHRLDVPARLAIFRPICSAVQHAHQKGVIHRDLKPTNILVESHDGRPVPKVIDFGLAKATSGMQLSEHSLFTAFGSVTGTPLYMAPEQAVFNALDVDTRADIYALGVILYELLTGSTPIERATLGRAALDEMLRVIREVDPPTPSSRIGSSPSLPSVAAARHVEPIRLSRLVRGDLDWIVMKALAKERDRRYDSAIGLANDVERFLNDEPVTAGPPTARYRTAKFIRRHRGQVVAASLVALALVGGGVGTTLGLFEARRQRDLARVETTEKEEARSAEADQRLRAETARQDEARSPRVAERRSDQLGKVNEILGSIFRDLDLNQAEREGKPVAAAIGERLDQASAALDGESIGDPLTVARMQMTLGQAQSSLSNDRKAVDLLERSRATLVRLLGPDDRTTLACIASLALATNMDGQYDRAIALLEPVIAVMKAKLGPDDPDTLAGMDTLAMTYFDVGRFDRAVSLYEQVLEARRSKLGPDHRDTLTTMDYLATAFRFAGRLDRALPLHEQVVEACKVRLGPDHLSTAMSLSNLAYTYQAAGQLDRAILASETALKIRRAKLGPDNPYTALSVGSLAAAYQAADQLERAIALYEQSLDTFRAKSGPDHPETVITMYNLATAYEDDGQFDRAIPMLERSLEAFRAQLGPNHFRTLRSANSLATAYRDTGRLDRAIPLHERTLEAAKTNLGPDHPQTLGAMRDMAGGYRLAGRHDRAVPLFEQALAGRRAKLGPDHPDTLRSMTDLAGAYADAGAMPKAIALDRECLAAYRRLGRAGTSAMAAAQSSAGSRLLRQENWAEAEPILRDSLATREANLPDDWRTFHAQALLGGALLGRGKHDEARPLLVAGLVGMERRLATIPAPDWGEPVAAADRLIRLAEATNHPDEAKRWREEKARVEARLKPPA